MQRERLPSIECLTNSHTEVLRGWHSLQRSAAHKHAAVGQQRADICAAGDSKDSDWAHKSVGGNGSVQHNSICRGRCSLSFSKARQSEAEAAQLGLLSQSQYDTNGHAECTVQQINGCVY